MRRGSVVERAMKCGKPECPCHTDASARHGPYRSLVRVVEGKTRTRYLDSQQAEVAADQVQAAREFKAWADTYFERCERWADAELEPPRATSDEAPEKKGSRRRSRTRS
ncbi:hypothetical protein L6R50_13580 [Myxococcota bacterium]|nr:hypothetical protein [Myxococcota bacterium]